MSPKGIMVTHDSAVSNGMPMVSKTPVDMGEGSEGRRIWDEVASLLGVSGDELQNCSGMTVHFNVADAIRYELRKIARPKQEST